MANGSPDTSLTAPTAADLARAIVSQIVSVENIERLAKGNENAYVASAKILLGILLGSAGAIGAQLADVIVGAEEVADPAFQRLMAVAFKDITGVDIGGSSGIHGGRSSREGAARSLGAALIGAIAGGGATGGGGGSIEPSSTAAESYVTWVTQMALEGWLTGLLGECVTLGQVEALGDLDDALANSLGLGRMTRRVMGPLLDAKVITPFRWYTEKTYRPTLLSAGETARQVARGRWTREQGIEELARQGYSNDRIEAIFNTQRKFFSAGDVRTFVARGHWSNDQGIQHLKDNGYEHQTALDALRLEGLRRIEQLEDAQAAAILSAYQSWEIDRSQMLSLLNAAVTVPAERNLLALLAETRRELGRPRLTLAQVEQMVKSGVLSVIDYRNAARRRGYPEEDVMALELQLRWELNKTLDTEQARAEAEAQRAVEQAAKAAAAAARKLEIEAQRAAERRGSEGDLERAAVRGLIPLSRLEEVYRASYDADTVALLLALVEDDRQAYLETQARRDAVAQRAESRGLSVSQLEASVFEGLLTVEEFRRHPTLGALDAGDRDLLAATLAARLATRDEARATRRAAERTATQRTIDLGRFEQLVRRGARTFSQYDALLASLGVDEAGRAGMGELLQLQIADDAAAVATRAAAAAARTDRGLTLEQAERAVVLGALSFDELQSWLVAQRFTPDAQRAIVAIVRARLAEAEAARQRRLATGDALDPRALPLATVRRAARLGVISPDVYVARLRGAGYTDEDVAIDLELLLVEIADIQAARARRRAEEDASPDGGISLAQLARAVRLGVRTIDDYRALAAAQGKSAAAIDLLVDLLESELAQLREARDRRGTIEDQLAPRNLSLAQLEEAVKKGLKSVTQFAADVVGLGYGVDDAELLTALLILDLEAAGAGAGAGA